MPLGILTDEEFEKEVNRTPSKEVIIKSTDDISKSGRNEGDLNKPESLRQVIAECKIEGSDDNSIKEVFKTSSSSIHAYANGKNGTNDEVNDKLAKFVKSARASITRKASRKLIAALDHITEDKISELKANEISVVAKNLSSIISENEHKTNQLGIQSAQFLIYAPQQKTLDKYDVIDVSS